MTFDLLVLVAMAGLFLFVYLLLGRMDRLLWPGGEVERTPDRVDVVIFGASAEVAPLTDQLSRRGLTFRLCPAPRPTENTAFRCALALSGSDLDNLLFCRAARRSCASARLLARCNDPIYRGLFADDGVSALLSARWTPDTVLRAMLGGAL